MRILLACPYAWDDPGGVQVHVRELGERLLARGHEVLALTPARARPAESWVRWVGRPIDLRYNASNAPICPWPSSRRRVGRWTERFAPDLIHAHEPLTPSTAMFATLGAAGRPVVATFHSGAGRSLLFDIGAPVLRRIARRIRVRIAVSEAAASFVRRRIGGDFEIVPNGIDRERFADAEPADLPPGRRMLFVGRLDERKGFPVAVAAFHHLAPDHPDLWLVVAGDGPDRRAVDRLAGDERRRVIMLGSVPNAELPPYHAASDLLVAPSVGGESFGIVLAEAMASGLPVVASDIPGYREVVDDGREGLLVPPRDASALAEAAARVLDDPDLAARYAAAGRDRSAAFDRDVVIGRLEAIYRSALER